MREAVHHCHEANNSAPVCLFVEDRELMVAFPWVMIPPFYFCTKVFQSCSMSVKDTTGLRKFLKVESFAPRPIVCLLLFLLFLPSLVVVVAVVV